MHSALGRAHIDVSGALIEHLLSGFRIMPSVGLKYLVRYKLLESTSAVLRREAWYPFAAWLDMFEAIGREIGPNAIAEVGRQTGNGHALPNEPRNLPLTIEMLDVTYHLKHRNRGKVMFDRATREKLEGIGRYTARPDGPNAIATTSNTPYPCSFDTGLISALAQRALPRSVTSHHPQGCRNTGASSCVYITTW